MVNIPIDVEWGEKQHQIKKAALNAYFFQECISAQASWEDNQSESSSLSDCVYKVKMVFLTLFALKIVGHQHKWSEQAQNEITTFLLCLFQVARVEVGGGKTLNLELGWQGKTFHGDFLTLKGRIIGWRQNAEL